ncbi:MAG: META domain-containing protein [Bacteroidetes bacterium]|jgi:heat shock protein HslJ|nr:META domain-containing protein [Bacteroidota bacterium]
MKKIIICLGLAVSITSCTSLKKENKGNDETTSTVQPSLHNTKWTLIEQVKGKTPTLVIENEKITGNAGCNNYFGNVKLDPNTGHFETKGIGSTRMTCPNMGMEANFLKMLGEANRYIMKKEKLELYKDKLLLLQFTKLQ